jgi:hypothetical protein
LELLLACAFSLFGVGFLELLLRLFPITWRQSDLVEWVVFFLKKYHDFVVNKTTKEVTSKDILQRGIMTFELLSLT